MGNTQVNLVVCGSLPQTEGCYGSASLGPFGRVGATDRGQYPVQSVKKGTVTRYTGYTVDVAAGSGANEVALYIYKKVDTINQSDDTVSVTLFKTVTLPLIQAPLPRSLPWPQIPPSSYIGTNQDDLAGPGDKENS